MTLSKTILVLGALLLGEFVSAHPPAPPLETNETTPEPEPDPVRKVRTRATVATELMRRGDQALREDNIRAACNAYQQAHTTLPSWWMPRLAIVRCGRVTGVPNKALLAHAAYAVKARPQIAITHLEYGAVLEEAGRKAEAARAYQAALRMDAQRFDARIRLGILLAELGQFKAAQRHLQDVLRFRPRQMRVLLALGTAHEGLGELNKAEKAYRKFAQKSQYPAEGLARLIQFYTRHGMDKKSAQTKRLFQSRFPSKK